MSRFDPSRPMKKCFWPSKSALFDESWHEKSITCKIDDEKTSPRKSFFIGLLGERWRERIGRDCFAVAGAVGHRIWPIKATPKGMPAEVGPKLPPCRVRLSKQGRDARHGPPEREEFHRLGREFGDKGPR